ncbi:hypothetical protein ACTXT7_013918 [Hymenolepis weldensis]
MEHRYKIYPHCVEKENTSVVSWVSSYSLTFANADYFSIYPESRYRDSVLLTVVEEIQLGSDEVELSRFYESHFYYLITPSQKRTYSLFISLHRWKQICQFCNCPHWRIEILEMKNEIKTKMGSMADVSGELITAKPILPSCA